MALKNNSFSFDIWLGFYCQFEAPLITEAEGCKPMGMDPIFSGINLTFYEWSMSDSWSTHRPPGAGLQTDMQSRISD